MKMLALRLLLVCAIVAFVAAADMPDPFYRVLDAVTPNISGNDVIVAQELLNRDSGVSPQLTVDGPFAQHIYILL
jgi:hypothetical protein